MSVQTRRITHYLSGKLSQSERKRFEDDLQTDPDLRRHYQMVKVMDELLVGKVDLDEIENDPDLVEAEKLVNLWRQEDQQKPVLFLGFSLTYLAVACFALMLIILKFLLIPNSAEKLFLSNYEKLDPTELSEPDMPTGQLEEFLLAKSYYDSADFEKAASAFGNMKEIAKKYPQILLYLGASEMENGRTASAAKAFKEAAEINGPHTEQASFYAGLSFIRLADPRAAMMYFTEKSGLSKHFNKSVQKMLRRVNLINTFQFKQLSKEMREDKEVTAMIGPGQKTIFFVTIGVIYLLAFLAFLFFYNERVKSIRSWLWMLLVVFFPLLGSLAYICKGIVKKKYRIS